ncbi:hypothetical protein [Mumia quercus]|uniref:hypothetical protein n=1 Tax=Mumia quercus TaxID=2976125 RepID=UPI0021CF5C21|nr:hypothetical protein [Mumia quercus]
MLAAWIVVAVLALLAAFQLALACGAPWGAFAWGGQARVLPASLRVGSALSIVLYAAFAVVVLDRSGEIDALADGVASVGAWVVFVFAVLSVVVNALSRSRPERYTMTPTCVVLAVATFFVATS